MANSARRKFFAPLGIAAFLGGGARAAELDVSVVSPLVQVFPDGAPPGEARASVEAARGEWEPFQIVVRAPRGQALGGVRASAGALDGPSGATVAAPRLYRVEYLDVRTPSSIEGHAGRWPDALIPDVDAYAGERRRAFPFDVPAGEARAVWVELFVPPGTPPGVYRGAVTVAANGGEARVPVELTVHRFTLPATPSLPVTFGFAANALPRAHGALDAGALAALARRYALAALRHRVSLHGGTMEPPPWTVAPGGRVTLDFRAYDAEVGPFLDGTADPGGPAEGARWTAIDLRVPERLDGAARDRYTAQLVAHLRARGWLDRVFDYTFDEPGDAAFAAVRARAERLHRAAPEIPRLVTHEFSPALAGAVEIWCPVVNRVDDKAENPAPPPRDRYPRIWWYQSCMSHGCDIVGGDYFTGWPSLAVDAPPLAHRILEWLTFRYRTGGELYYNTVEAYGAGLDPWRDQRLHGGNGDGTLFYPGTHERIGGRTPIPVESIRLKLIREGLEDYEYLRLYAARAGAAQADAVARSIAPRTFSWQHDPRRLYAARREIATVLDGDAHARERQHHWPWRSAPTARRCAPGAETPKGCGKL